jgi:hypothetical protein
MDLPQIEVIGLETPQRFFQHLGGQRTVPAVRAHFRHQKNAIAAALQGLAHPVFRFAAVVLPAVVEKGDAAIDGLMHNLNGGLLAFSIAQVMPAKPQRGNLIAMPAEIS